MGPTVRAGIGRSLKRPLDAFFVTSAAVEFVSRLTSSRSPLTYKREYLTLPTLCQYVCDPLEKERKKEIGLTISLHTTYKLHNRLVTFCYHCFFYPLERRKIAHQRSKCSEMKEIKKSAHPEPIVNLFTALSVKDLLGC